MSCPFRDAQQAEQQGGPPPTMDAEIESANSNKPEQTSTQSRRSTEELKRVTPRQHRLERHDDPVHYQDYLRIETLLSCQQPISHQTSSPAHDEMLFIIMHQTYELWFKQMLHEIDSIVVIFSQESVPERELSIVVSRLQRITEIQKVLIEQLRVLETMTPLDFLDFRDLLAPASGFQSMQFRILEAKLGLRASQRLSYGGCTFMEHIRLKEREEVLKVDERKSLFTLVERWLERTPFLQVDDFEFWGSYRQAVHDMLNDERESVRANEMLTEEGKTKSLAELQSSEENLMSIFNEERHNELIERGDRRLSYRATQAALFISLYRDEPILHMPFRLLTLLLDVDDLLTTWRYRHALMVHRMLGIKTGTGGSTGYYYLRSTAARHKIFSDFFNLSSFLIPRSALPALPQSVVKKMGFLL